MRHELANLILLFEVNKVSLKTHLKIIVSILTDVTVFEAYQIDWQNHNFLQSVSPTAHADFKIGVIN